MSNTLTRSVLISAGETFFPDMRLVNTLDARYLDRPDAVDVTVGASCLLLTVADAALLVDMITVALEARTSTLRVVA